jgi:ATP-dependent Clp protease ATP-binding subunit ClpC
LGTKYSGSGGTLGFLPRGVEDQDTAKAHEQIQTELKRTFRPEFLNRVDEIIIFSNLTVEDVERIVDLQMEEISHRLRELGLQVELTDAARKWLARAGFDPQFGARPLRRALQRHVESPLSVQLLRGEFRRGGLVVVDVGEDGLLFEQREGDEGTVGDDVPVVALEMVSDSAVSE